jgi:hypothetical protein
MSSLEERACARRDSATCTTLGEEGPFDGSRKARHVPGRNQANAYVNYSSLSKSGVLVAGFRQDRANKVIPHRQVIEPNMYR